MRDFVGDPCGLCRARGSNFGGWPCNSTLVASGCCEQTPKHLSQTSPKTLWRLCIIAAPQVLGFEGQSCTACEKRKKKKKKGLGLRAPA